MKIDMFLKSNTVCRDLGFLYNELNRSMLDHSKAFFVGNKSKKVIKCFKKLIG